MSDVWSTSLRDARPDRRYGTVPKLQCCGHRSEHFYLISITPAFGTAAVSARHRDSHNRRLSRHDIGAEALRLSLAHRWTSQPLVSWLARAQRI